jgi:prolyl oligopeptidase
MTQRVAHPIGRSFRRILPCLLALGALLAVAPAARVQGRDVVELKRLLHARGNWQKDLEGNPRGLVDERLVEALKTAPPPRPEARKRPVTDRYHGVEVADDYRWLERWDDPEVQAWSAAQNAAARAVLDRLPGRATLRQEVAALRRIEVPRHSALAAAGGRLFALLHQPPKQQPALVVLPSADEPAAARVVVDLDRLDPSGATSLDWYVPSPDGALVAVSLSRGGSERGDLHLFETATGKPAGEVIERVNSGTAGGSVAWDGDGRGFFYTRYPAPGEVPPADLDFHVRVFHHRFGTPAAADTYEIGKDFPKIAEIHLSRSPDGRFTLANVQNGDSGEFEQHLRAPDGRWLRLTRFEDRIVHGLFGGDALYLLSRAGAPRGRLLAVPLADLLRRGRLDPADARVVVPESDGVLEFNFWNPGDTLIAAGGRLLAVEGIGGLHRVRIFDLAGKPLGTLPLPPVSAVAHLLLLAIGGEPGEVDEAGAGKTGETEADKAGPINSAVLFQTASFTEPPVWHRWDPATGRADRTALSPPFPVDLGDVEVVRDHAVSKDGTRVPLTLLHRKGLRRDGANPARLTGYGGYGWSLMPAFEPEARLWLDRGGVLAVANLRGGGEFGEEWHRAGTLTRKQNVFDDFIACAEHLVRAGYTRPERLAIEGGSNGGLLMGAALTQRPDLFAAVVSHVGIYDMLRVELDANGVFNVPEYGTVTDPGQFRALHAYSPYHRVRDGAAYPPVLLLTGANDTRVNPMHSRKLAARLQAAGAATVLLRTSATTGHGGGTPLDEQIEIEADVLAFLFHHLKVGPARP